MEIGKIIYEFITFGIYKPIKTLLLKVSGAPEDSQGYGATIIARLIVYGAISCILASLLGVKKNIDRLFKWAQR
jgi:hypothetical protein